MSAIAYTASLRLFVIHLLGADVRRLMEIAREAVQKRFGVVLIPEVKVIAPDGAVRREL